MYRRIMSLLLMLMFISIPTGAFAKGSFPSDSNTLASLGSKFNSIFSLFQADEDVFEKLYDCQSQSQLHNVMGEPDYTSESRFSTTVRRNGEKVKLYAAGEDYYDIDFLGRKCDITVRYSFDDRESVSAYEVVYSYSSNEPTTQDKNEARKLTTEIVDFYTSKYGIPMTEDKDNIYDDYKWTLPDGDIISIDLAYDHEHPIRLFLEFISE